MLVIPQIVRSEVRVGVILPLTGGAAIWGEGIKRGLELANAENPGLFKFIYEDERFCDSKQAVTAAHKLIKIDAVKFLITGCLNGTKAITPLAKHAGVPILSAGLLDEASISKPPEIISFSAQIGSEASQLAAYLRSLKVKMVSVFRHDDSFTLEFFTQLERNLQQEGDPKIRDVTVTGDSFPWTTEIAKTKARGSEVFLVYLGDDELLSFMRSRLQLKDSTPVLSGYIIESNFSAAKFGDLLSGIRYTYPALASESDEQRLTFEKKFAGRYGTTEKPSVNAYFVFDGIQALAVAVQACEKADADCLWSRLQNSGKLHRGVSGEFRFLDDGSIERSFVLKEVQGTTFVQVREK